MLVKYMPPAAIGTVITANNNLSVDVRPNSEAGFEDGVCEGPRIY